MAKTKPNPLNEGDEIRYSLSQELPYPKGASTWVKFEAATTVREGETASKAKRRLITFVEDTLNDKIQEFTV